VPQERDFTVIHWAVAERWRPRERPAFRSSTLKQRSGTVWCRSGTCFAATPAYRAMKAVIDSGDMIRIGL